jgi:hypothetical protein
MGQTPASDSSGEEQPARRQRGSTPLTSARGGTQTRAAQSILQRAVDPGAAADPSPARPLRGTQTRQPAARLILRRAVNAAEQSLELSQPSRRLPAATRRTQSERQRLAQTPPETAPDVGGGPGSDSSPSSLSDSDMPGSAHVSRTAAAPRTTASARGILPPPVAPAPSPHATGGGGRRRSTSSPRQCQGQLTGGRRRSP